MASSRFDERLQNLAQERTAPSAKRAPSGPIRSSGKESPRPPAPDPEVSDGSASRLGRAGPLLRFTLGALWLFATMRLAAGMQSIQDHLNASPTLRPHEDLVMLAVVLLIGASMIGFAWRIKRTAFRAYRRDAGWALSLGAVTGFVLGVGPQEVIAIAMADAGF